MSLAHKKLDDSEMPSLCAGFQHTGKVSVSGMSQPPWQDYVLV